MPALRFPLDDSKTQARVSFQALKLATLDVVTETLLADYQELDQASAPQRQRFAEDFLGIGGPEADEPVRIGTLDDFSDPRNARLDRLAREARVSYMGTANETLVGTGQRIESRIEPKVVLYLPQALEIADGVEVDNFDIGVGGALAQRKINQGRQSELTGDILRTVGSIISAATAPGQAMHEAAGRLALREVLARTPALGGDKIAGFVGTQLRTAVNPNTRAAFQSVPLREFNFSFVLQPTSPEEVATVKQMIKLFRTQLYPRAIDVGEGDTAVAAGWEYPNVWEINQYYGTEDKPLGDAFPACLPDVLLRHVQQREPGVLRGRGLYRHHHKPVVPGDQHAHQPAGRAGVLGAAVLQWPVLPDAA